MQEFTTKHTLAPQYQINSDKLIAIGDIHGNLPNLKKLLTKLKEFEDYTIVFLGDYIDRGIYVKETVQYLIDFKKQRRNNSTYYLLGNHEYALGLFLGLWEPKEDFDFSETWKNHSNFYELWNGNENEENAMHLEGRRYGGCSTYSSATTFKSYGCRNGDRDALLRNMPQEHINFIKEMPWILESKNYYFVHAGLDEENLENQLRDLESKNVSRERLETLCGRRFNKISNKTVVSGHTYVQEVEITKNRILCDTSGGRFDKPISAIVLDSKKVIQSFETVKTNLKLKRKSNQIFPNFSYVLSTAVLLYGFLKMYGGVTFI
eukprot:gene3524-6171_t